MLGTPDVPACPVERLAKPRRDCARDGDRALGAALGRRRLRWWVLDLGRPFGKKCGEGERAEGAPHLAGLCRALPAGLVRVSSAFPGPSNEAEPVALRLGDRDIALRSDAPQRAPLAGSPVAGRTRPARVISLEHATALGSSSDSDPMAAAEGSGRAATCS